MKSEDKMKTWLKWKEREEKMRRIRKTMEIRGMVSHTYCLYDEK
jgi:hypothetical protein